jgi:hypothetical protein
MSALHYLVKAGDEQPCCPIQFITPHFYHRYLKNDVNDENHAGKNTLIKP